VKIKSSNIQIELNIEEAIALAKLLGNISRLNMMELGGLDEEEAQMLQIMYGTLSAFVPTEEA
jgi:hypothetical protein